MIRQLPLIGFSFLLFLLLGLAVTQKLFIPSESFGMLHALFVAIDFTAIILALIFGRSTLFLLLFFLSGLALLTETFDYFRHASFQSWAHVPVGVMLDFAINFFAPPVIAILSFFHNRALLSPVGLFRIALIVAVLIFITLWLYFPNAIQLARLAALDMVIFPDVGISHVVLLIWIVSLGLLFIPIVLHHQHAKVIFFVALFGALLAAALPNTLDYFLFFTSLFSLLSIFFIVSNSYYMAYIDELTNIKGRRAMNEALIRLGGKYCIVMVDIDHFKKFNDTYGHDVGDEVLKLVAQEINRVSGGGEAFRWGGEEFAIIFNGKNAQDAFIFADKVRQAIETHPFYLRSPNRPDEKPQPPSPDEKQPLSTPSDAIETIHVTVSMGIGEKTKEDASAMDVMKKADDLLYVAKESGRNCVKL